MSHSAPSDKDSEASITKQEGVKLPQRERRERFTILDPAEDRFPWKTFQKAFEYEHELIDQYWDYTTEETKKNEILEREKEVAKQKSKNYVIFRTIFFVLVILTLRYIHI